MGRVFKLFIWGVLVGGLGTLIVLSPKGSQSHDRSYVGFFEQESRSLHRQLKLSEAFTVSRLRAIGEIDDIYSAHEVLERNLLKWEDESGVCGGYPSKPGCDDGDSVLFNGLLCFAGISMGCKTVRDSFNQQTGEWVRSPRRVSFGPLADDDAQSFSRDHMLGVLLYVSKTKDFTAYKQWQDWMRHSPKCILNLWGNCIVYSRVTHLCRTFKFGCLFLPGVNRLSETVLSLSGGGDEKWRIAEGGNLLTEIILRFELMATSSGYPLHLKGVGILMLSDLGYDHEFVAALSKELVARDSKNLFFQYLNDNTQLGATDQTRALINQCEYVSLRHDLSSRKKSQVLAGRHQWSFERDSNEKAWQDSMGWDCVFLGSLLRSRLRGFMEEPGRIAEEVVFPDQFSSSEIEAH